MIWLLTLIWTLPRVISITAPLLSENGDSGMMAAVSEIIPFETGPEFRATSIFTMSWLTGFRVIGSGITAGVSSRPCLRKR